jgi:hypothetical protein
MVVSNDTNHKKRMARVRILAEELHLKAPLNTGKSRTRCIRIAQEIARLLQAEDIHQRRLHVLRGKSMVERPEPPELTVDG